MRRREPLGDGRATVKVVDGTAEHLGGGVARQALAAGVPERDVPGSVQGKDRVVLDAVEQHPDIEQARDGLLRRLVLDRARLQMRPDDWRSRAAGLPRV